MGDVGITTLPVLTFVRPLYGPDHAKGPTIGPDVLAWKRMLWRWDDEVFPGPFLEMDDVYNRRIQNATRVAQQFWRLDVVPTGNVGKITFDRGLKALRERGEFKPVESAWDRIAVELYRKAAPRVPPAKCFVLPKGATARDLGGVAAHMARPLGNWQSDNAIDVGAAPNTPILAPKTGFVSKIGGHPPEAGPIGTIFGESITITCPDGDQFFMTHTKRMVGLGERVVAGELVALVANWPGSVTLDHVHVGRVWGRNPEELWDWPRVNPFQDL